VINRQNNTNIHANIIPPLYKTQKNHFKDYKKILSIENKIKIKNINNNKNKNKIKIK